MKTLARLRQVRKRGGCQAAKTEVSCVNHEKGRERTIRIEKREGGESEIAFLIVTRTAQLESCKLSRCQRNYCAVQIRTFFHSVIFKLSIGINCTMIYCLKQSPRANYERVFVHSFFVPIVRQIFGIAQIFEYTVSLS